MAWQPVESYSFGFSTDTKKFWLYYTLKGTAATTQVFLTATQFTALAQLFGSASAINYETTGKYFASQARTL